MDVASVQPNKYESEQRLFDECREATTFLYDYEDSSDSISLHSSTLAKRFSADSDQHHQQPEALQIEVVGRDGIADSEDEEDDIDPSSLFTRISIDGENRDKKLARDLMLATGLINDMLAVHSRWISVFMFEFIAATIY